MHITVLVPTMRVGGLDVLCDSLSQQSYTDFDLIIVDGIHQYRADIVTEKAKQYPFTITHLAPRADVMDLSNYSSSINLALAHAKGSIILMQCDYTWLSRDCIKTHAEFHQHRSNFPADLQKVMLMLDYSYIDLPAIKASFPVYGPESKGCNYNEQPEQWETLMNLEAERYENDLKSDALKDIMWSLFENPMTESEIWNQPATLIHSKQGVLLDNNWCSLKNESIPLEAFLSVNGLDEDFDGSHLHQDTEISWRMAKAGYQWMTIPGGEARTVNSRRIFFAKRINHSMSKNRDIMMDKQKTWEQINPSFNLREIRKWVKP